MGLPPLGKLSAAEYAELAKDPKALMRYNSPLPEASYGPPYAHQEYPKFLYRVEENADGKRRLRSALIANSEQEDQMRAQGWLPNPKACNVETAPGAPEIRIADAFEMDLPDAPVAAEAATEVGAIQRKKPGPKPKDVDATAGA